MNPHARISPELVRSLIADAQLVEVVSSFDDAGIRSLLLRGQSTRELLHEPGELRTPGDLDLLPDPAQIDVAERQLKSLGFVKIHSAGPSSDPAANPADRWLRSSDKAEVELHHRIRLVGATPEDAWAALWEGRTTLRIGDVDVAVLSVPARALGFALQVAYHFQRHHQPEKQWRARDDLERAVNRLDATVWDDARQLARTLDAEEGLATGLDHGRPGAQALRHRLGLRATPAATRTRRPPPDGPSPFAYFDGIFCLNLDDAVARWRMSVDRYEQLGISKLVERFPAVATPEDHHVGCALSFRLMVAEAQRRGYERVLILEDDAIFLDDTIGVMNEATAELTGLGWDLCYLGGAGWGNKYQFVDGSSVLQHCGGVTCTHAVAIHERAYAKVLADIPRDVDDVVRWLDHARAIDQYFYRGVRYGELQALILSPHVASQPFLLGVEWGDLQLADRYVI